MSQQVPVQTVHLLLSKSCLDRQRSVQAAPSLLPVLLPASWPSFYSSWTCLGQPASQQSHVSPYVQQWSCCSAVRKVHIRDDAQQDTSKWLMTAACSSCVIACILHMNVWRMYGNGISRYVIVKQNYPHGD